jgi:hypothetical protein
MAKEEDKAIRIKKIDGIDFVYWKMQIDDILYRKELHQPLLGEQPDDIDDSEWVLLDRKAMAVVRLSLSKSVAHDVVKEKTTAGLMAALSSMYEKSLANNKVHLMKKLFNLKMAKRAFITPHPNDTQYCPFFTPLNQTFQGVTHPGTTIAEARLTVEF